MQKRRVRLTGINLTDQSGAKVAPTGDIDTDGYVITGVPSANANSLSISVEFNVVFGGPDLAAVHDTVSIDFGFDYAQMRPNANPVSSAGLAFFDPSSPAGVSGLLADLSVETDRNDGTTTWNG